MTAHDPLESAPRGMPGWNLLEVRPAKPQRHRNLTVFPLCADAQPDLSYLLLVDALGSGTVTIREVGSGTVPTLLAHNHSGTDVLILDGEQLIGAKQNRLTNRSIILAAGLKTEIPVTCMEHGRWHFQGEAFRSREKPRHAPSRVRRKAREVEAMYAHASHRAGVGVLSEAQVPVWNEISAYEERIGSRSATGALDELYDHQSASLDDWAAQFPLVESQVGLLAFLGGHPLGLDVIGGQSLYARLHERFLGGYLMDALGDRGATQGRTSGRTAEEFLDAVRAAGRGIAPTVGKGTYRLLSGRAIGGELEDVVDGVPRLVHGSAFPGQTQESRVRPGGGDTDGQPLAPPSRRQGWSGGRGSREG